MKRQVKTCLAGGLDPGAALTSDGVVELGLGEDVLLDELERSGPVRQPLAQAVLQARPLQQPLLLLDRRVGRRVLQDMVLHQ